MARHRYGVAFLFPADVALEIQGLRRALGAHLRIEPHITLVPPINLHDRQLDDVMASLVQSVQAVSSQQRTTIEITIGSAKTFSPLSPVTYLGVEGDEEALARLHQIHAALHVSGPFARPTKYAYVPHVTVSEDSDEASISAAVQALRFFSIDVELDRIWLLRDNPELHRWERLSDVTLEPPVTRGHGGLALQFRRSVRPGAGFERTDLAAHSVRSIEAMDHGRVVGTLMVDGDGEVYITIAEGYDLYGITDRLRTEWSR
jgi:2'-5' RNA ligase